jgi:hypothetical protein
MDIGASSMAQACVTPTPIEILERDKHRTKSDKRVRKDHVSAGARYCRSLRETHGVFRPLLVPQQYF